MKEDARAAFPRGEFIHKWHGWAAATTWRAAVGTFGAFAFGAVSIAVPLWVAIRPVSIIGIPVVALLFHGSPWVESSCLGLGALMTMCAPLKWQNQKLNSDQSHCFLL